MELVSQFEQQGFCVVPAAVSPALLKRLRADFSRGLATVPPAVPELHESIHDYVKAGGIPPVVHSMAGAGPHGVASRRYPNVITWADSFLKLVDNPAVRPLLAAALGDDFILDHDYGHALRPFSSAKSDGSLSNRPVIRGNLHNVDHVPANGSDRLWDGTTNLVTVVYDLIDAAPDDGGFGCLPRSHMQGYKMPIPRDPDPVNGYPGIVARIPCHAGSCVVFAETLRHCSLPWTGSGERHTVFLKFSPQADAYRKTHAERAKQYEGIALRDVATLDRNSWERIHKMLSLVHSESARL